MAKILLAEDDQAIRDMLQRALNGDGHEVVAKGEGLSALESGLAEQFDLLVSDISMPGLDGVSLAEKLLAKQPGLPVLLMSAIADELARAGTLASGSVRVLNKPLTLEKLRAQIAELLGA